MKLVLRLPVYRRLLAAYLFNELAWTVGTLALSLLVYRRTGSAIGSAGFFLCSQFAPAVLAPALVIRLDRGSPRRVLPTLYALEAVLFGVLAWFTQHFMLVPVLALALVDGLVAGTARSLASAARTEILKAHDLLHEGNAVVNVGFSIAFMAGPIIGGAVIALGGTIAALVANSGLFALMALVLAVTRLPTAKPEAGSVFGRLREGIRQVHTDTALWRLLMLQMVGMVFFTISVPVEVVYAQHTLHAGAGGYGILVGFWGGGAVAGAAIYARWRRLSGPTLIAASSAALGVGFATMMVAPSLGVALVGAAVAGAGNGVESVAVMTAIQERTSKRWLALVMSLSNSLQQLAPGLGIVAGGVIAELASARAAFGVGAAGSLLFAVATMALLAPVMARTGGEEPAGAPAEEAPSPRGKSLV